MLTEIKDMYDLKLGIYILEGYHKGKVEYSREKILLLADDLINYANSIDKTELTATYIESLVK